jgi:hypothetical protein
MDRRVATVVLVALLALAPGRVRAEPPADPQPALDHRGRALAIAGGIFATLYGYTYLAWYARGENAPSMHFQEEGYFGVDTYAGGADKLGHAWGNYALVRGVSGILEWGGFSRRTSLLTATGMTLTFFTVSEIKDGYRPEYGFAWGDMLFNAGGEALGVLLETVPRLDEMFDYRVEYWPSKPFRNAIVERGPFNSPEDYTGQRYFLAYHLGSIRTLRQGPYLGWSRFVDVALGFHAAHYKPEAGDSADHQQDLFVGLTFDLQALVDELVRPSPGQRALRFTAEIVQLPFTTLRLGGVERSTPDLEP